MRRRSLLLVLGVAGLSVFVVATIGAVLCKKTDLNCHLGPSTSLDSYRGTGGGIERLPSDLNLHIVAAGLHYPTDLAFLSDDRVAIAEKDGLVRLVKKRRLLARPMLDLTGRLSNHGFRGLLSIATDPAFPRKPYIYVVYTWKGRGERSAHATTEVVSRFTVNGNVADPSSEKVILGSKRDSCHGVPPSANCIPAEVDHDGADIAFGSDGTMFVTTGDGGGAERVEPSAFLAQNLNSLAGKVLHVTTNGAGVPSNPLWNGNRDSNRSKIWAWGFRNPYRVDVLPGAPRLVVGDVGWNHAEEVDFVTRGRNYGWPCWEGTERTERYSTTAFCRTFYARSLSEPPRIVLRHPRGVSLTGGVVLANATELGLNYRTSYLFGDWGTSELWTIPTARLERPSVHLPRLLAKNAGGPSSFAVGPDGAVYYLALNLGELRRISAAR